MNIAIPILLTPPVYNGLSKYIINLISSLQELNSGHKFYIILNKELDDFIRIDHPQFVKIYVNIPHKPRLLMRPFYFFWQNFLCYRIYKKYSIDLVHLANPIPLVFTAKIPHVITIHDLAEFKLKRHSFLKNQFRKLSAILSAKKATRIITVSNYSKKQIIKYLKVNEAKIKVVYLASDIIPKSQLNRIKSRKQFLHVGGDRCNKNISKLLNAYAILKKEFPVVSLLLVGIFSKKFKREIKSGIYSSLDVVIEEHISNEKIKFHYLTSLALVYPSLYEGFGLPLVEAMSCGLPVITSNKTSMPEIGANAVMLVNPLSSTEIYDSMKEIVVNGKLRNSLKNRGIRRSKDFSWHKFAVETSIVYSTI